MIETSDGPALPNIPPSWNQASADYPRSECIHSLFAQQAALTPDAIALNFGDKAITYCALNNMANAVADTLKRRQLAPGMRVAISQQRCPELVAAVLGILKAGDVYVPVDLSWPDERLRFVLDDASVRFVLASAADRSRIARSGTTAGFINLFDVHRQARETPKNSAAAPSSADPAYIMYTSGSTGTPKGVVISHRSVVRLVRNTNYVEIAPHDVFLLLAPASFDASTFEIFAPLLNGARLAIAPPGNLGLSEIGGLIERHRVSILWLTAGLFHAMVDECPQALRNVRQLLAGGDVLSVAHVRAALAAMERGCVINGYGPTENTTFTCCFRVTRDTELGGSVPIGTPVANSSVYILDSHLCPVRVGQVGEIFIGGDGLALTYLNQPVRERAKFITLPLGPDGHVRLYRSGDLGRFTPSGVIEFCGRADDQVKIRGYRIEPGEIEAAAMYFAGIAQAIVLPIVSQSGEKILACHYLPRPGFEIDAHQLRSHLERLLPAYMIPSQYQAWSAFPLASNGKVDRKRLLESSAVVQPAASSMPEGLGIIEGTLLDMYRSLLGRNDISMDDDFFAAGGHSLAAARLFAQIEKRFDRRLPLATMFRAPSVRQLAAILRKQEESAEWSPLVPIRASGRRPPVFLVHAVGGNVLSYKTLHTQLPPDQPIYAFQSTALKDGRTESHSIEEVAAVYIAAMRSVRPRGPYYLGGFSAGGIIAYEMAQQLVRVGQEVPTVLLLDTALEPSPFTSLLSARVGRAGSRALHTLLWNLDFARRTGLRPFTRQKAHNLGMNIRIAAYKFLSSAAPAFQMAPPGSFLTVEEAVVLALGKYVPDPYEGSAVLLQTSDSRLYNPGNADAWAKLVKHLEVIHVPGDHESMFRLPEVRVLADTMANILERAASEIGQDTNSVAGIS